MGTTIASTTDGPREVRRNYIPDPRFTSNGWLGTPVSGGAVEYTSPSSAEGNMLIGPALTGLAGATVSFSIFVQNIGTLPFAVQPRIWDGVAYTTGSIVPIPAGESRLVKLENATTAGTSVQPRLWKVSPTEAGASIRASQPILEVGAVVGSYFDGGTSPDPDLTPSWVGTPNASESILTEIVPIVEATPELVDGWDVARDVHSIVHPILNRPDPDVTLRASGLRSGRFRMLFPDQQQALEAFAGMCEPLVFTITDQDVPAVTMTFVVAEPGGTGQARLTLDDETRSVWWVEVPFTEVAI